MLLLNSGCGPSAQNHKFSPERQFLITMTNSAQAFKQNEQSSREQQILRRMTNSAQNDNRIVE